jgi:hypothetical protein
MPSIPLHRYGLDAGPAGRASGLCAWDVGSEPWCASMNQKPKGEGTANEAGDNAKHCLF